MFSLLLPFYAIIFMCKDAVAYKYNLFVLKMLSAFMFSLDSQKDRVCSHTFLDGTTTVVLHLFF
jgi:hypothetical protein